MSKFYSFALAALVASVAAPTIVPAQQVSEQRIVSGLGKLTAAAPIVDVAILRQEAMSGKTIEALPNWSKVAPVRTGAAVVRNSTQLTEPQSTV